MWTVPEETFDPEKQHHKETIFTIGNGYLSTRGAFEEGYPGDSRATFIVDKSGVVRYKKVLKQGDPLVSNDELLAAVKTLGKN